MKTLDDFELAGKRVLVRVDINTAVIDGKAESNTRVKEHSKTLKELSEKGAKVVVLAHQGRKGGEEYLESLDQHAKMIGARYVDDLFGAEAVKEIERLKEGEILLLKNTRSWDGETKKLNAEGHAESDLVQTLKKYFDLFILDALSIAHRSQASVVGFSKVMPSCAGRVLQSELKAIEKVTEKIEKPFLLILGGKKPSDYMGLLNKYLEEGTVDQVITCGLFGQLCQVAHGIDFGAGSKFLESQGLFELLPEVKKIKDKLTLPIDFAVEVGEDRKELTLKEFPCEYEIYDIGKETVDMFRNAIREAKTIFVKGTMGDYRKKRFIKGTKNILEAVAKSDAYSLVGGGDSSFAVEKFKIKGIDHVSLSGGALLEYLAGKKLPGLEVLE